MDNNNYVIYQNALIPSILLTQELDGLYNREVLAEMGQIIKLYEIYEKGADFTIDVNAGYIPASLKVKSARSLVDKEARFLFSKKPDFFVTSDINADISKAQKEQVKNDISILQNLINSVVEKNNLSRKLLQAAKDCFIGKRVALICNFNDEGIGLNFIPSLEFIFDVEQTNVDKLNKIVTFYTLKDNASKEFQKIYKKKYWIENNVCWYEEGIYNGLGELIEEIQPPIKTLFNYIPAVVIINDGLTGDLNGVSEIEQLKDYESWYARLSNADIDAQRKGMNPITYTVDMAQSSTKDLSRAAGAFWDLQSDYNSALDVTGQVGVLENSMSYSAPLDTTMKRIKKNMYQLIDMPDVEEVQAQLSSGKALKSIYWGLIVRCDEKMLTWKPALEFMCKCIIDGAKLYPNSASLYIQEPLPTIDFTITVDNQYSLPEDELEAIQSDLTKVNAQVMSKKSFMKRWQGLNDDQAMEELEQIALEREMLEDSFSMPGNAPMEESEDLDILEDEEEPEEVDEADQELDTLLGELDILEGKL